MTSGRFWWSLLHERGITALISTAYLDEASRFHRLSLLHEGRVLAAGEPDKMQALAPGSLVILQTRQQMKALATLQKHFPQAAAQGTWLRVFVDNAEPIAAVKHIQRALAGLPVQEIYADEPELEDVFIALLRREKQDQPGGRPQDSGAPVIIEIPPIPDSSAIVIEAQELTRDFGPFRAVDKVSFQVRQGEIFRPVGRQRRRQDYGH